MPYIKKAHTSSNKYRKRKIYFWLMLLILFLLLGLAYLLFFSGAGRTKNIRAGICGAVKIPAVYTLSENSDLSELVRMARGTTLDADIDGIDFSRTVFNDTIYHIPSRNGRNTGLLKDEVKNIMSRQFVDSLPDIPVEYKDKGIKQFNILYVGLPAVYILISYYPSINKVDLIYIPHSTVLLVNDYRLMDIFFTLDIRPTVRLLENKLCRKIDYYVIQTRSNFIDMVDDLGGIVVDVDKEYAEEYKISSGRRRINGFLTWEYIRYIDMKGNDVKRTREVGVDLIHKDNFKADPETWSRVYDMRTHRQQIALQAMLRSFDELKTEDRLSLVQKFPQLSDTDLGKDFLLYISKLLLLKPTVSYSTLPGYYSGEGDKLFYYPDIPSFDLLRKQAIRNTMKSLSGRDQVVY